MTEERMTLPMLILHTIIVLLLGIAAQKAAIIEICGMYGHFKDFTGGTVICHREESSE